MIKFGTGGWRAVIAEDFTKDNLRLLTAGLCRLMEKEGHAGEELCVGYDRRFLSKESAHWIAEVLAGCITPEITILIGPEGDFSPEEARLAMEAGFIPVHLGASRLRTETAAVTAATAVYLLCS